MATGRTILAVPIVVVIVVSVMAVVTITVMISIVVMLTVISIMVAVPAMVMLEPSAITFPIAVKETLAIVARLDPTRSLVGGPGPIAAMPPVVSSDRIPIALYPNELRSWCWFDIDNAGRRWGAN